MNEGPVVHRDKHGFGTPSMYRTSPLQHVMPGNQAEKGETHMPKKQWLIALIVLCILSSGCGVGAATMPSSQKNNPTALNITRINILSSNHYQPFASRTITDLQAVQNLYSAMLLLPHAPSNGQARSCPVDWGLEYRLNFSQESTMLTRAIIDMGGCGIINLGKKDTRTYDEAFLQLLAHTVGVSEATLNARPLYSCTPHSPCLTPTP